MTLGISIRRPLILPRIFWAQSDKSPQDYHWIGNTSDLESETSSSGGTHTDPRDKKREQKYRPLSDITLGDVEYAYKSFEHQLVPAQENWIGKDHFCQIPLKRRRGQPPMVFGRVKTCYPSDGFLDNVEELEMYFPNKDGTPDLLHLHVDEISHGSQKQVLSFFVKLRLLASVEDRGDLEELGLLLRTSGFLPEFDAEYLNLLDMTDGNHSIHLWMYVIGSRWFNSIPDSRYEEVKAKLKEMIGWGKQVFNYHPEWLGNDINTLNRVLGFKYGFTPTLLTEPGNAQETAFIVAKTFEMKFLSGRSPG